MNSIQEIIERVNRIDLGKIRQKFITGSLGKAWSPEEYDEAEESYRRFLVISALYPAESFVPTKEVDEIWHMHILDTRAYQEDCQNAIGFFLHHVPTESDDEHERQYLFEKTQARDHLHFSHSRSPTIAREGKCSSRCSRCRTR